MKKILGRRQFLRQGALVVAGAAGLLTGVSAPGTAPTPIIDAHVHFYDPTRPGGIPWPPRDNKILYSPHLPAQFRSLTDKLGVVGAVVIEADAEPADNRWVLELAKTEPFIVGYIARLVPGRANFTEEFESYAANPIFRGLRLRADDLANGLGQIAFERDLQKIAERGLTLDIVGGPAVIPHLKHLAKFVPRMPLVIDHLPFPEWDQNLSASRTALKEVSELPNVFAKISNVLRQTEGRLMADASFYKPQLDLLWELFGADRVIFGSNWPVSDAVAPYSSVQKVVVDYVGENGSDTAEKFFWRNSLAAYRWQPREAAGRLLSK